MSAILDGGVFPGTQGGPLEHVIAAKAVAFGEALSDQYKGYCKQVVKNAQAMARAFNEKGNPIGIARPNSRPMEINNMEINLFEILPSSGILIKYDPGVPLVYMGFAITLFGSVLSIISTQQLWIISEEKNSTLYIGGLSNRNSSGFAKQFPLIIKSAF